MNMKKYGLFLLFLAGILCRACYYDNEEDLYQFVQEADCTSTTDATFAVDVMPLLLTHCNRCHRDGRADGNVNLEGYNNVKPYVDDGSLFGTTNHEVGYSVMPTNGIKIPACEIEKMRIWIEKGALNN